MREGRFEGNGEVSRVRARPGEEIIAWLAVEAYFGAEGDVGALGGVFGEPVTD